MSQGAWQNWDNKDYTDYLERYYGMQLTLARTIVKDAMIDDFAALTIAVFNKIASPSVYLQPHFKKHMADKNKASPPSMLSLSSSRVLTAFHSIFQDNRCSHHHPSSAKLPDSSITHLLDDIFSHVNTWLP